MAFIDNLEFIHEQGVTCIKETSIEGLVQLYDKLINKTITKDEIDTLFMQGLTSGEILRHTDLFKSRQAIYFRATNQHGPEYTDIHRERRQALQELFQYYFGYEWLEMGGDIEVSKKHFEGAKKELFEYYIEHNGQRDIWELGSDSQSRYAPYFKYANRSIAIERVIEQLKEQEYLTVTERELINLEPAEIESLKAGFGRVKRKRIEEEIIAGTSKERIKAEYHITEKQYKVHSRRMTKRVQKIYQEYEGNNHYQWIKYRLKAQGTQAKHVIDWMINQLETEKTVEQIA